MELVLPSARYRESFLDALAEYHAEGRYLDLGPGNFNDFLAWLADGADPDRVPPGFVPQTTYWLVEDGTFLGRLSLRHELNDSLRLNGGHISYDIRPAKRRRGYGTSALALGLDEARKIGLARVLITCDDNNIGSRRIIEANGGVLQDRITVPGEEGLKRRYWIELGGAGTRLTTR